MQTQTVRDRVDAETKEREQEAASRESRRITEDTFRAVRAVLADMAARRQNGGR